MAVVSISSFQSFAIHFDELSDARGRRHLFLELVDVVFQLVALRQTLLSVTHIQGSQFHLSIYNRISSRSSPFISIFRITTLKWL